ncbi:LacI family DNA-binding transcriptional regulator [Lacisediminihabitans sp.]|jgi:LacI family transcriptional regulator|uniref:LacI family DNA-binding transcriptional regulator n=1 Tax=Lacisediminihabitans sp. TaxID=2787631 RepID=UPI002F9412E8
MDIVDAAPARRATRADVARYAGVSPAVVSYTVNAGPRAVAPATRARVQEAIRVLGYRPNAVARALKIGHTKMFGVVVPDSGNPFFVELGRVIEQAATAHGYALIVVNFDDPGHDIASSIRELALRQVDGMIVAAQVSMPILAAISECGIRTVLINQFSGVDGMPSVGPDLYEGARTGVNHLIWHGHTNIGYVGELGPPDVRERGWRDALTAAGLPAGPEAAATFTREGGYAAGKLLIAGDNRPTAIFVSSDFQAIGVLRAIHEAGIAIPAEIAVVSFDGSPEAEYTWPGLTTVQQPVAEMAEEAVERLVAPTASDAFSLYATRLIVRQSCGCGMPPA